jgi:hypothetical protein
MMYETASLHYSLSARPPDLLHIHLPIVSILLHTFTTSSKYYNYNEAENYCQLSSFKDIKKGI